MRKLFAVTAMASICAALSGCTGDRLSDSSSVGSTAANSYAYEPPGSVTRAPLGAPPGYGSGYGAQPGYGAPSNYGQRQGYGSPPPLGGPPAPLAPYGNSYSDNSYNYGAEPQTTNLGWQASPRWSAIEGDGCVEVEPGGQTGAGTRVRNCANKAPRAQAPRAEALDPLTDPAPVETMAPPDY